MSFAHLHVHTEYSIDGMTKIREMFTQARLTGMPGLAITDHGTLSGVPEFLSVAEQYPEVKPVVGCEFWITDHYDHTLKDDKHRKTFHLILIAKNLSGYHNLVKLCSIANCEGTYYCKPRISHKLLEAYHDGLLCLSACIGGEIPQKVLAGEMDAAKASALWYKQVFGDDYYLEVSLHRNDGHVKLSLADDRAAYFKQNRELVRMQKKANAGIFEIGKQLDIKVVATNDVHYMFRGDSVAHDVMLCIQRGKKVSDTDRLRYSHLEYMKSEKEMRRLFPKHPEAIDNTMDILNKVERYSIRKEAELPHISEHPEEELRERVSEGALSRLGELSPEYQARLNLELEAICQKGFAPYFLMMKDLADWVRSNGWVVGPGRGSAPGSLVNYCLGITDIDPIKHNLLFERFLVSDCLSLLNIDVDMEYGAYAKIAEYLKSRYGKDSVSGIITFGKIFPKKALNDVGKALGISKYRIKKVQKLHSDYHHSLLWDVQNNSAMAYEYNFGTPLFREAYDVAQRLCGVIDNEGVHACGWLISPGKLSDTVPVQIQEGLWNEDYTLNSTYEASQAEKAGVLRINCLGLQQLTIIKHIVKAIREKHGTEADINSIPLDDAATIALYAAGDTVGAFQFESEGMREWLRKLHPNKFSDLVAMEALYRPGPIDLIPSFVARKNGEEPIEYTIPELEEILGETYGIIVYQEQTMRICERIAGFSPEQANRLRKAVGKRKIPELEELHEEFVAGGMMRGYDKEALEEVWKSLDNYYAFMKAHALCYTWISYQTAWLKAHYPKEFFTELLNANIQDEFYLEFYISDCEAHGFAVTTPDKSDSGCFEVSG